MSVRHSTRLGSVILSAPVWALLGWAAWGQTTYSGTLKDTASGFTLDCGVFPCASGGAPRHAVTGDADLDKAVAICDAHRTYEGVQTFPETVSYERGFEGCGRVIDRWGKSEAARREAEWQAKVATDRAFVEQYVKGLEK